MLTIFEKFNSIFIIKCFKRLVRTIGLYTLMLFIASSAYSAQALYTLTVDQNIIQQGLGDSQTNDRIGTVNFDITALNNLRQGTLLDIPIPGGKVISGKVVTNNINASSGGSSAAATDTRRTIISLDNGNGSVELDIVSNAVTNMLLHDVENERIYTAAIDNKGAGQLIVQDNDDYYCVRYPETDVLNPVTQQAPQVAELIPSVSTLRNLESRPGSANVLFVDYWGGSITNTAWNANFNSNNPINYTAYDVDGNPGNFSSTERYSMWLAWREAVEDFAPFNINVTTSRSVYNAAAVTNRTQMVVTTTSSWYGNAGGVAYVNVFDDNSNYYKVGWTWNLSDSSMGMTISHEAGHQLGLSHDGIGGQSYYQGHGVWGPIMGAPFGKPYVQWSKGEYPNANEQENDISIITGKIGTVADEAGNSYASATNLSLPANNKKGLTGFQDTDAYKFTLNSPGPVEINVIPLLGDEDESRAANLAMDVSLVKINSSGSVISNIKTIRSSDNSPLSPLTNKFDYSTNSLSAGTYALRVRPVSADTNWATGFGNYGNAGEYRFSVIASTGTGGDPKTIGRPTINRSTDRGIFIWENSTNNWVMNVVSGDAERTIDVDVSSQSSLNNVVPISIESSDSFTQSSNGLDMSLNVKAPWMDGVKFTVQSQSDTCVSTSTPNIPIYLGPDRVQLSNSLNLTTLETCGNQTINTRGKPSINRSTDRGIFIWENTTNNWVMNVVSGDAQRVVEVDVQSQKSLNNVIPVSIESSDVFTQLSNSLDMSLNLQSPWMDGAKFTVQNQSSTCVSTTNSNVHIFIGPQRVNVSNNINLETLTSCQ